MKTKAKNKDKSPAGSGRTSPVSIKKLLKDLFDQSSTSGDLLSDGVAPAIASKVQALAALPIAQERGFRVLLVAEMALVHRKHKVKGSPPPRNSVDRWMDGTVTPSLSKYLLLELAINNIENRRSK